MCAWRGPEVRDKAAEISYRLARIFLLVLAAVMPLAAVTAAREIALVGTALFGAAWLVLGRVRPRATALGWAVGAFALASALSVVTAVDRSYSLGELRAETLKGLICFFAAANLIRRPEHVRQLWSVLLVMAGIMGLGGVVLFFADGGRTPTIAMRASSLHYGYGAFATYLATMWPLVLVGLWWVREKRARAGLWAVVFLTLVSAYLTISRGCWLAMVVESALIGIGLARRRKRVAMAVAAGALAVVVILGALPGARHGERLGMLLKDPAKVGGTLGDLISVWSFSLKQIAAHPFTGIGVGRHSFSKAFPEFRATHQPLLWHAHNMWLDVALQMGVQGVVALGWVFVAGFRRLWPRVAPGRGQMVGLFCLGVAVMLVGFGVRNLTDDFFADDSALMLWLLLGAGMAAREVGEEQGL